MSIENFNIYDVYKKLLKTGENGILIAINGLSMA